ncbi:MAG: DUF4388 domain-containing protein [Ktedonobacteraceae bacterium]
MTINASTLQGSLKDFSLIELLQMMEMGGTTGAIRLKQPPPTGRLGILYFQDGKVANCSELDAGALTLGDVLQQLGMANQEQIEAAFAQQLLDPFGKRIGERLVAMGVITDMQLHEALRIKVLWTARELALWKEGTYEFIGNQESQNLLPYRETSLNLEVMPVIMEMVRYSDEWEQLQRFLPQGVRTILYMTQAIPYSFHFDMRTLELFFHVNLFHRVRRVATSMRRPEQEAARDLAYLVYMRYLTTALDSAAPRKTSERDVCLPAPAERLRMEGFELPYLISRMEEEWYKRRTPMEQLPALAEFANWTMDTLAQTCHAKDVELDPNTLQMLLYRENLRYMGNYEFKIVQNHIDIENFTALCYEVYGSAIQKSKSFYEEASRVLQLILRSIFQMINSRVASIDDRIDNEGIWEALFERIAEQNPS